LDKAGRECNIRKRLQEATDHCGAFGFSATRFSNPCAPNCTSVPLDTREHVDEYPINRAFPGLTVLNEDVGLFQINDFMAAEHLQAPFTMPREERPSVTAGNREYVRFMKQDPKFCERLAQQHGKPMNFTASENECMRLENFMRFHSLHREAYQRGVRTSFEVDKPESLWAEAAEALHKRLDELLPGLTRSAREAVLISRYEPGGFYTAHVDGRRCTVIIYANEEGSGGATYFPVLDVRVPRKTGRAVVFFPRSASGFNKMSLLHIAEEQLEGEKRILQIFIDPDKQQSLAQQAFHRDLHE